MKLRIGRYAFDWWTQFISNIEHRGGVVALGVRHKSGELEILDACAAGDMHQTAQGLLESARRYRDRPGVIVGFLTVDADRSEAVRIADNLLGCRWVHAVETDGWTRDWRDTTISSEGLAKLAHESATQALYGYRP